MQPPSPSVSRRIDHSIPFGQSNSAAPGSLGYGFGMSAASRFGSPSAAAALPLSPSSGVGGWRGGLSWGGVASGSGIGIVGNGITTPTTTTELSRRRRRSLTPPSGDEEEISPAQRRTTARSGKKARLGIVERETGREEGLGAAVLGKAIAALSKESLATLLTTLITTQPTLRPLITSLLPPPTLSTTRSRILVLERTVLASIPAGGREDYIWGRVRSPLEEYLDESKGFMRIFCEEISGAGGGGEEGIGHPSTTFAFLYALTSSFRRIEASLPSPPSLLREPNYPIAKRQSQDLLTTTLLPLLAAHWSTFLDELSRGVNEEGRVMSGEILRGWVRRLEELSVESPGVREGLRSEGGAREVVCGVREKIVTDLGWMIGIKRREQGENENEMDEEEL